MKDIPAEHLELSREEKLAVKIALNPKIARVSTMSARWQETRRDFLKRQAALPKTDKTGHSLVNNIPVRETKDITVGMTEFPKDQDKEESNGPPMRNEKGYRIPFRDMDDNQVRDREHFDNEKRLPVFREKREESRDYKPASKQNLGLNFEPNKNTNDGSDFVEAALRQAVGLPKYSIELDLGEPEPDLERKPVEHKPIKKAPGIKEYEEPASIPRASGQASEAITKMKQVQEAIAKTQQKLLETIKPIQKQLSDAQAPLVKEQVGQQAQLKKYIDMAYQALQDTETHVVAYKDSIMAAVEHQVEGGKAPVLADIVAKAEKVAPAVKETPGQRLRREIAQQPPQQRRSGGIRM